MRFKKNSFILLPVFFIAIISSCTQSLEKNNDENVPALFLENTKKTMLIPDSVSFCGQTVYLSNFDVRERLDKELVVNINRHSATIQYLKRANRFFPRIEEQLKESGIPEDMKYLCLAESGLAQVTSRSGAKGFWQFMPPTAKEFGLVLNDEVDERLHVEKSTIAACDYLKKANFKFNDWFLTAAAYNRGQGGIERELEKQQVSSYFDLHLTEETSRYVFRILALKIVMENPEGYGFSMLYSELYEPIDTKSILVTESIEDLAFWAKENGTTYRIIKLLNPWVLRSKLTINSKHYTLLLPA